MKIAFDGRVFSHSTVTGVEIYARNIFTALNKEASLDLLRPNSKNRYLQQLWEHTLLPIWSKRSRLLFCPVNIAPIWLPKSIKLVVTLHDVAYLTFPESVSWLFGRYYRWLIPRVVKRADAIITISNAAKDEIVRHYPEAASKINVVHLGLPNEFLQPAAIEKNATILYVGSLNERKNFASVIEAFERLAQPHPYRLVMVGNFSDNFSISPTTQEILKRAKSNPKIDFLQGVSSLELHELYGKAKLFVFPSFYEGFGLPPLESMACGTPVITSNISSMPEVCGDAAIYVDPFSVEDITQKMKMVLEDESLQQKMIVKGLEHVKQFTWEKAAKEHLEVFEKVLSR